MCNGSKSTHKQQIIICRRARTKNKKPRFLSLRLGLSNIQMPPNHHHQQQQLSLFPLLPKSVIKGQTQTTAGVHHDHHDDNMVHLFGVDDGGPTTLTELLNADVSSASDEADEGLTYAYGVVAHDSGSVSSLARTALRNRERDAEEEKWVSITEVVENKSPQGTVAVEEQVTSGSGDGGLRLKLDYGQVLNEWSAKGPLYVNAAESPQTVPDSELLFDDFFPPPGGSVVSVGTGGIWRVPEETSDGTNSCNIESGGEQESEHMGPREASVLRYKEKRQSRLFSKRIRYEVRKLNAEKRPRIKGRFVRIRVD